MNQDFKQCLESKKIILYLALHTPSQCAKGLDCALKEAFTYNRVPYLSVS